MIGNNSLHSNNAPIIPTAESLKITTIIGLPGFIGKTIQGLPFCRLGSYIIPLLVNNIQRTEGGNLAASKIRNLECPNYEICLIDYGCGKFNRKIHIMEQYP